MFSQEDHFEIILKKIEIISIFTPVELKYTWDLTFDLFAHNLKTVHQTYIKLYFFSGSVWLVEYTGTRFNQVQATLKFDPLYWRPFFKNAN